MAIFDPLLKALGYLLSLFYALPPHNLGVAIILLTFTIMGILYPLTAKQAKSMIRMQMVQPEIKRIQAKYKNDRAKLNEEMMAFYQENKINPLAGCLPLLIQMPIFFALFQVLKNPYKYVPDSSKLYDFLCTYQSGPKSGTLATVEQCGKSAKLPNPTYFLSMNLSLSAPDQIETLAKVLAFGLVIAVMFTGYMQSRQAQKRTPAINKQMALITKILPVFFGFISLNFPSGLVVYFFVSNLWRLGQQEVIFRRFGSAADPKHKSLQQPAKGRTVDAESRERDGGVATATAELEAGDTEAGAATKGANGKGNGKGAKPGPAKASPAKSTKPAAPAGGKQIVGPSTGGGGLRGLFKPPPPASGKPAPAKATPAKSAKPAPTKKTTPSSSTSQSRPGEAGRRTSKNKKKKR